MVKIDAPPAAVPDEVSPAAPDDVSETVREADASFDRIDDVLDRPVENQEPPTPESAPTSPPLPLDGWESSAVTRWRWLALFGVSGTVSVLVIAGLIRLLLISNTPTRISAPTEASAPSELDSPSDDQAVASAEATEPATADESPDTPQQFPEDDAPSKTEEPAKDDSRVVALQAQEAPTNEADDLLPSRVDLPTEIHAETVETKEPEATIASQTPLGGVPAAANPLAGTSIADGQLATAKPENSNDPFKSVTTTYKPPLPTREIDVAARLEETVEGIQFENTRLIDYLRFVSQLSTIPIALDPYSVRMANVQPATPIRVSSSRKSMDALLTEVLQPRKLAFQPGDRYLVIKSRYSLEGLPRNIKHQVSDLTSNDLETARQLADDITRLISPGAWEDAGGLGRCTVSEGVIDVHQSLETHFAINELLERLRMARGLAQRRPNQQRSLTPTWTRAGDRLTASLTYRQFGPIPFMSLLARIEQQADVILLPDWEELTRHGLFPDHVIDSFMADGVTLEKALRDWLLPLGLTFRPFDEDVFQITTIESADRRFLVEFYRREQLAEPVDVEVRRVADQESGYLLISAPSSVHQTLATQ